MNDFTQTPSGTDVYLDHIAHWVPDPAAAERTFTALGFAMTPLTAHSHSPGPGEPQVPAGSSNQCIMLREGYLEILCPTSDTPVGREIATGIDRYVGVHLAAFSAADTGHERERLIGEGFGQRPLVGLERPSALASGETVTLRFSVSRPEPGLLPEGRVQFLTHHTPDWLWEPRWLAHDNTVERLTDLLFCVADVDECAARYARYLGRPARPAGTGKVIALERGTLTIVDAATAASLFGREPPALPWMAAYGLACADLGRERASVDAAGYDVVGAGDGHLLVALPADTGGIIALHDGSGVPWG